MPIAHLLTVERVAVLRDATDREGLLSAAATLLAGSEHDVTTVLDSLRLRERMGSTAIGHGVAIPHGRIGGLDHARGAFIKLRTPVPFDAGDDVPVDLVFAMAVPQHFSQEHLHTLAELAARFGDEALRAQLRACDDPSLLHALLLQPASPGAHL